MIFKSNGKAVRTKARNIRNTEKPNQSFRETKITNNSKKGSVLCYCVTSFCVGCFSDLKINICEVEFPPPRSHTTSI